MKVPVLLAAIVAASIPAWSGCSGRLRTIEPPKVSPSGAASDAIAEYDANKDGKLAGFELDSCPSIKSIADQLDPRKAGVTADMIAQRIREWQESKVPRLNVNFLVTRNNQPLSAAVVTLVPEKFLGSDMKTGTGSTSNEGRVIPSVPTSGDDDFPGMPCGFYRVEITKPGENIPAQYNTATTLGVEISSDKVRPQPLEFRFDLKY